MPQHKSAEKRMVTNERDRKRNRGVKSAVRRVVGDLKEAIGGAEATARLRAAHSALDKASKKGVLHPRRVDRMKSRLAKSVHRASS